MRVAFLLQDLQLRPGVGAVVAHAASLDGSRLVLTREQEHRHWAYPGLEGVPVVSFAEAAGEAWDVAVCTGGATASAALALRAERHACLLVEDDTADGVSATALPLTFLVPTRASAALVADLQPGSAPRWVPTPVTPATAPSPARSGVLDVAEAVAARPAHADHAAAIASASAVVALEADPYDSLLLAVASGTPVASRTDHPDAEAIVHGVDGLLVDPGDALALEEAIARAETLTPAPPASPAASAVAGALRAVLDAPAPASAALARRVAADLATAAAEADALRAALAAAHAPAPPLAPSPSFARRAARAAKRRLRR